MNRSREAAGGWDDSRGLDPWLRDPGRGDPRAGAPTRGRPTQPGVTQAGPAQPGVTQAGPAQPGVTQARRAQPGVTPRASSRTGDSRGRGSNKRSGDFREPRGARGSSGPGASSGLGRWGSLPGGIGVGIIAGCAVLGAIATAVTRAEPGPVIGACIMAGTAAAGLAVRPRAGYMIFPVPVLCYLMAALAAGIIYDRSADSSKTALALGATQWIANGFLAMALATALAIVLIAVRWFIWRRGRRVPVAPSRRAPAAGGSRWPQADTAELGAFGVHGDPRGPGRWNDPAAQVTQRLPGLPPGQPFPGPPGSDQRPGPYPDQRQGPYPDQRPGPRRDQRPDPRPGSGPYNFSSGA